MIDFRVYDESDAPEAARPMLEAAKKRMGFVTTLNGVMAESPELLAGYNALAEQFGKSSLPGPAKHVVWITASVENGCEYCVAAHSTLALRSRVPASLGTRTASSACPDGASKLLHISVTSVGTRSPTPSASPRGYEGRPPNCQLCTSMSAYRSVVSMVRAVSGSGARTSAAVPSQVAPLSDNSGP